MPIKNAALYIRKSIVELFLFLFLFSSAGLMFSSTGNTSYSSFSTFLVKQRSKNGLPYTFGEVKSKSLQNYTSFYWYADDVPGSNLRGAMHTFFRAVEDNLTLYSFEKNEKTIDSELLLYTTWDFKKFHYNFDIISNDEEVGLSTGEIYITESLANQFFSIDDNDYASVIGQTISCNGNELTIKGIVLEKKIGFFKQMVGKDFVLGNYNYKPFVTNKLIYNFVMFGSEVDTFADIVCIEGTILSLNSKESIFESYYYDYQDSFTLGKSQLVKYDTINNHNKSVGLKIASIAIFILLLATTLLFFVIPFQKISTFRDIIQNHTINNVFDFLINTVSFSLVLVILKFIGLIDINNFVINVFDFNIVTPLFITWNTISLVVYFCNSYFKEKKGHSKPVFRNNYCELDV